VHGEAGASGAKNSGFASSWFILRREIKGILPNIAWRSWSRSRLEPYQMGPEIRNAKELRHTEETRDILRGKKQAGQSWWCISVVADGGSMNGVVIHAKT